MALGVEALADRRQHRVGAAEPAGRRHRDDRAVLDERAASAAVMTLLTRSLQAPDRSRRRGRSCADSSAASAAASDQTPSSPVAEGLPSPRIAAWKRPQRARIEILAIEAQLLLTLAVRRIDRADRLLRHARRGAISEPSRAMHLEAGAGELRTVKARATAPCTPDLKRHIAHGAIFEATRGHAGRLDEAPSPRPDRRRARSAACRRHAR